MKGRRTGLLSAAALVVVLLPAFSSAIASDEFYLSRLREGVEAFQAKRTVDAIDRLRIACFGLLDTPASLEEGLAVLSLAYADSGRTADVDVTLIHFLEVERKFGAYPKTSLSPTLKSVFETLLLRTTKPEVLAGYPNLASIGKSLPTKGGKAVEKKK